MSRVFVQGRVKTKIMDAKTGRCLKESPWQKNLVLDNGLNVLARKAGISNLPATFPALMARNVIIGSSSSANKIASGAITFTQSGTTLTASAPFFTNQMVGAIFKWGTGSGGLEEYITVFTSTTVVTVGTSTTVGTPDVGTVWMVQQTGLQTQISVTGTKSYQTNSGDCQTTYTSTTATHQRTFIIPQQASTYTVNEIGYASNTVTSELNACCGRIVLAASDVVGTSNFYVIILQLSFTYSPSTPTAVTNVGTNINTAGNAMIEDFGISTVASDGSATTSSASLDGSQAVVLSFATATYSQRGSITQSQTPLAYTGINVGSSVNWTNDSATRGRMTLTFAGSTTTSGQSLFGIMIGVNQASGSHFDIKFTTTQTAPNGTFTPNAVWECIYNRILTN